MEVVRGIDALTRGLGPSFVVVGVFDGLHLGHRYLLDHLVREAAARAAQPTVITFDHHPDEVLTGKAPPLLMDPDERLERLGAAGVAVAVVQPFDEALRQTPYQAFVERLRMRVVLTGFLMTPDAAFGFERRGTPEALTMLGTQVGFDVVVVPPFTLDGRAVRSTDIRAAIEQGDLAEAALLLGRPVRLAGRLDRAAGQLRFEMPVALPPDGDYAARSEGEPVTLRIEGGEAYLRGAEAAGSLVTVEISGRAATAVPRPPACDSRSEP